MGARVSQLCGFRTVYPVDEFRVFDVKLRAALRLGANSLLRGKRPDGHWVFPLEADATIPADFILLQHFLGRIDDRLNGRIAAYLRRIQAPEGGWPQYAGGAFDLSVSVKAYFALKVVGDPAEAPHMRRARAQILAAGGAERANTFARIQLALFGVLPWNSLPAMPVEMMLLPRWFPVTIWRMAYWSRTFIAPSRYCWRYDRARAIRAARASTSSCVSPQVRSAFGVNPG